MSLNQLRPDRMHRDGFVAERDALAGQLLVVGQQIALTDQQPHR